jgi:hypothetical protein
MLLVLALLCTSFTFGCVLTAPASQWLITGLWILICTWTNGYTWPYIAYTECSQSPLHILKTSYMITRHMQPFAYCSVTESLYVCFSMPKCGNPLWPWSQQVTSPVLPMYQSTCFLHHTLDCVSYPHMKDTNVIHRFFENITQHILTQEEI